MKHSFVQRLMTIVNIKGFKTDAFISLVLLALIFYLMDVFVFTERIADIQLPLVLLPYVANVALGVLLAALVFPAIPAAVLLSNAYVKFISLILMASVLGASLAIVSSEFLPFLQGQLVSAGILVQVMSTYSKIKEEWSPTANAE